MKIVSVCALVSFVVFHVGCGGEDPVEYCEPGTAGCSCRSGPQPCNSVDLLCSAGKCVECDLGSQGCGCIDGACVTPGLECEGGLCVSYAKRPEIPLCYTPCLDDLERPDGSVSICSAERLLPDCIGVLECVDGSCLTHGGSHVTCAHDSCCPDFQTCIGGRCYSTCEADTECEAGWSCYRHVCRKRCNTFDDPCVGSDRACIAYDGENGHCMPSKTASDGVQREVRGTYTMGPRTLSFTNISTRGTFTLTSDHPRPQDVIVTRASHVEYTPQGRVVITADDAVPLHWIRLDGCDEVLENLDCRVRLEPRVPREITVREAANPVLERWDGVLMTTSDHMGRREIILSYASRPEGAWSGSMYYFASFRDKGLTEWMAGSGSINDVENALVQRWARFKGGEISLDEFQAVLTSTINETWKWPLMNEISACSEDRVACYPYDNEQGYSIYTPNLAEAPIPTGAVNFPVSMNLRQPSPGSDPGLITGRIVTDSTLHYIGDSAVTLRLEGDPSDCRANQAGLVLCNMDQMNAIIMVGGRYALSGLDSDELQNCRRYGANTYEVVRTPWLVPGFTVGTAIEDGLRYKFECRDNLLPHGSSVDPNINRGLVASNPIPDGRTRVRDFTLVDGALINGNQLYILFKEHFESFMGASDVEGFSAYGILRLSKDARTIEPEEFVGVSLQESRSFATDKLQVSCSPELVAGISAGIGQSLDPSRPGDLEALAATLIHGAPEVTADPLPSETEKVHWVCMHTGLIDNWSGSNIIPCPEGSEVRYFTLERSDPSVAWPDSSLSEHQCARNFELGERGIETMHTQDGMMENDFELDTYNETVRVQVMRPGDCWTEVAGWARNGQVRLGGETYLVALDPIWRCADPTKLICVDDRDDLLADKLFYSDEDEGAPIFLGLQATIQDAFRYKTRFRSRTGAQVGFAPAICEANSRAIPYCYAPVRIEEIEERIDCAIHLFEAHCNTQPAPLACSQILGPALVRSFSYSMEDTNGDGIFDRVHDGFERLYAELLIMLGDESYTQAAASRFDLAGAAIRSFEGTLFEPPDGINLSGGAGFEMVSLYQAAQYYQMVLDRFYALSPTLWESLESESPFLTREAVTSYFVRVTRASTQKARVWSEIAKRYHQFNRPDLARRVAQRAYTSAYLESLVLSRMMLRMEGVVSMADWPEISLQVEQAQKGYRSALLQMRKVYDELSDEMRLFGFAPEYIPFPALSPGDRNAFHKTLEVAKERLAIAARKEDAALDQRRNYEVDEAAFQSELSSIRMSYEKQLAEICGTFAGDDGVIYPAITRYAQMSTRTARMGNPCGAAGTGAIHRAMLELDISMMDLREAREGADGVLDMVAIEQERVAAECGLVMGIAKYVFDSQETIDAIASQLRSAQESKEWTWRATEIAQGINDVFDTSDFGVRSMLMSVAYASASIAIAVIDGQIREHENDIEEKERDLGRWVTERECDYAIVNSNAAVKTMLLDLGAIEIDVQRKLKGFYLVISDLMGLYNEAQRLEDEQAEAEQLSINIAAARNDPNVRIYKNDAVLSADRTFTAAVRAAYMTTRVFEYYTSQCYEPLIDLFLVRMVSYGDISLESYLAEIEDSFLQFEYQYGNPDTRVKVLSLRDDILQIPRMLPDGSAISDGERTTLMRKNLADPTLLNSRGYIALPFATRLSSLSPLTRNHKILFIEAQMLGSDLGDAVARVYLRQRGTGTVRSVDGDKIFYRFPERTAVMNTVVGQQRVFSDANVYRNERLRDRPVVNTHWELVINQRDEEVNKDVNLQSLNDIILYVYYTDFTEL